MLAFFLDEIRDFLFDCFVLRWIGVGWGGREEKDAGGMEVGRAGCGRRMKKTEEQLVSFFLITVQGKGVREREGRKVVSRGLWR